MTLYYFSTAPPLPTLSVIPHAGSIGTLLKDWKLTVSSGVISGRELVEAGVDRGVVDVMARVRSAFLCELP